MVRCRLCNRNFRIITNTHLKSVHKWTLKRYIKKFGTKNCGFILPNFLSKKDPRFRKWKESLKKRPEPWNKGYTKDDHPSVKKIARTLKRKKIDNFKNWREEMKKAGKIPLSYPPFEKDGDLAELIGVTLGDGNIHRFSRTEGLTISSNANNKGFIQRYARLVRKKFSKNPAIDKFFKGCTRIRLYQKNISKRLGIPVGARGDKNIKIPQWISEEKEYLKRYLRGLYEAEGSFCIHKPTYTYKFLFANRNDSLLNNVYKGLRMLGFHPHRSKYLIQISKKNEVYKAKELIKFREY